jgi:hypothetical protein
MGRAPDKGSRCSRWILVCAAVLAPVPLAAQAGAPVPVGHEVFAGGEIEDYLRLLQATGRVPLRPWSVRGFSTTELATLAPPDTMHPWAERYDLRPDTVAGLRLRWVRPRVVTVLNTAFPHGGNDGPVWAGRGLTSSVQAGFSARYGPVSLTVAPVAFWAQNADFELEDTGLAGAGAYRAGRFAYGIDLPQRFGDGAYARLDAGESTLRAHARGLTAGISTAAQQWGPAGENPLVLGTNAGGFAHAFLGTASPADLWIGRVHGRAIWGQLRQSEYSPQVELDGRRFAAGLVVVFSPRGADGLELGAARFIHEVWPQGGPGRELALLPFGLRFKRDIPNADEHPDNQLASVFGRWVFPGSGFELYSEFVREDHSWDLRTLLLYPDDVAGYMVGFRKAWSSHARHNHALRVEVMSTEASHFQRAYRTSQAFPLYIHSALVQGHTHRGQLLAAPFGFGGAASHIAWDFYHPRGRWSAEWMRALRGEASSGSEAGATHDVLHAFGAGALLFGRRFDVQADVKAVRNLNRNFQGDAFNLHAVLGLRAAW